MSVTLYNMEQEIIQLEGEVATKNIMIESLQRELEDARKTITRLYNQISLLRSQAACDRYDNDDD